MLGQGLGAWSKKRILGMRLPVQPCSETLAGSKFPLGNSLPILSQWRLVWLACSPALWETRIQDWLQGVGSWLGRETVGHWETVPPHIREHCSPPSPTFRLASSQAASQRESPAGEVNTGERAVRGGPVVRGSVPGALEQPRLQLTALLLPAPGPVATPLLHLYWILKERG